MNYLIAGTSNYLINEEIKKIIGDEDYTKIDYLDTTMDEIVVEASYNDLFGSKKNIIVKNANLFMEKNEAATKKLEKYLENPNPNTTLIFVCEKVNSKRLCLFGRPPNWASYGRNVHWEFRPDFW